MTPDISFVCCVESGWLEDQAIRMIESLRRWGGEFANAPVFAVSPRRGVPLTSKTLKVFEKFNVHYLTFSKPTEYEWFPYLNKPRALLIAEPHITTELVGYLDVDLLIVDEPTCLNLEEGEDFTGCVTDTVGGSQGKEDPLEPYWQKICNILDVDIETLPWTQTEVENQKIRIHWNGGVFTYRRSSNFAHHYYEAVVKVLSAEIGSKVCGIFFNEQVPMSVVVIKEGMSWRNLPLSHNYELGKDFCSRYYDKERFQSVCIVHYHDCMWPDFMDKFVEYIQPTHPDVAEWLNSVGAMKNRASLPYKFAGKTIKYLRKKQQLAYEKQCCFI